MDAMEITKGSRHQKIIGDFGESILCNWLSRSGFEVAIVDHTGLDIIAYDPKSGRRLGITVKSRTRPRGKEKTTVNIFSNRAKDDDRGKLLNACRAFNCEPWIGVYVETTDHGDLYLLSLKCYDEKYRGRADRVCDTWKMRPQNKATYEQDPKVRHIRLDVSSFSWHWWNQ